VKCSFIISGYKCDEYIFRNIDSILDQDYKDYEIIIVLNGRWQTKDELAGRLMEKYGEKINLVSIDTPGLGHSNNVGFGYAIGDIVSFLSSDLYLMPGALRNWVDAFTEHPDCDFVYSGYRFVSKNPLEVYFSNEFDRYHLECENYIDGANPVRRNAVPKWDEQLKSLIDWDFFLSVTDKGAKGYYIKEPIYFAELPKRGGLSEDSNANWIVRRSQIQKKHEIPERKICITSLIDPEYSLELAKMAEADYRIYPSFKPHHYDLVYSWGFQCDNDNIQKSTGVFHGYPGHKAIHWIGQDIKSLMNQRWVDVDFYQQAVLSKIKNHFCLTEMEKKNLDRMRIEADVLYPPVKINDLGIKKDAISINDPELQAQLTRAMPDQKILLNDLNCSITVHFEDKFSNVLESLCKGNEVITNAFLSGVHYIQGFTNVPELRKMLVHAIRKILKDTETIEQETINWYKQRTDPKAFQRKLEKIAEKPIQKYGRLEDITANA